MFIGKPRAWLMPLGAFLFWCGVAGAGESRRLEHDVSLGERTQLELDLPYGDVAIEPGDEARVVVTARCKKNRESCTRHLERIEIRERVRGDAVEILVDEVPSSARGFEMRVEVTVPRRLGLSVSMQAGRVRVEGHEGDLQVHLKAGEVEVRMPHEAVRSVDLDADVGDVTLRLPEGRGRSRRSLLVGAEAHWDEGDGQARVDVSVLAGEVKMRLE